MMPQPELSLLWVADTLSPALSSLAAYLESVPHVRSTVVPQWPADLSAHDVVISRAAGAPAEGAPDLEGFIRSGGDGWR